ncbi:metal-dependent hydrolase [Pseudomonas fluorescens]|uniref:Inner membrane protein YbcI n=1 Tax=Pseudomonas fluorescens TaxID=294 RepID=A0A5E7P236_PSEFL|nr:metal-dependent hydrolase [Pseudomonas fluorescens]VVP43744.1 hypothetical protein PS880_04984 [Pseudomonas fluorescens]
MPTVITHAVIPLIIGGALGRNCISARLLIVGAVFAALPDIDIVSFKLGIAYTDTWGHRGAIHSIAFVLLVSALMSIFYKSLHTTPWRCFGFLFLASLSHGLLDTCTNGGLGVALFWPISDLRWFMPFTPIEVSPIGVKAFLSQRGWRVVQSELCLVWLPTLGLAIAILAGRALWPVKPLNSKLLAFHNGSAFGRFPSLGAGVSSDRPVNQALTRRDLIWDCKPERRSCHSPLPPGTQPKNATHTAKTNHNE